MNAKKLLQILQNVQCTPVNQSTSLLAENTLITPKFDPRLPVPPSTLRKPKLGEIAVSLRGSPLQTGGKVRDCFSIYESNIQGCHSCC